MKRPSPNATPARAPADPISPALRRLLSPLGTPPGGANSSEPDRIGRVGFWEGGDGMLVPAALVAAAAGKWRRWSSGEFGAWRRVPIPSSSLFRLFSSFPSRSSPPPEPRRLARVFVSPPPPPRARERERPEQLTQPCRCARARGPTRGGTATR